MCGVSDRGGGRVGPDDDGVRDGDDLVSLMLAAEDRGDKLHSELNRMDSIWAYTTDGSQPPLRFVALGRDSIAETRGDNEPTGVHVSNGSTAPTEQPGTIDNLVGARGFFTQQHGKNQLWEILPEAS